MDNATQRRSHEESVSYEERPWGTFTVLQETASFKVKRLEIKPGQATSLQHHNHRNEHWVVVSGEAVIIRGDEILRLVYNQSTYIPCGTKHRIMNETDALLVIIEVQCGDYLAEDDIVRHEDRYGRNEHAP